MPRPHLPALRAARLAACLAFLTLLAAPVAAADQSPGRLLFADDFNRNESDESREEVGGGWSTNSKTPTTKSYDRNSED